MLRIQTKSILQILMRENVFHAPFRVCGTVTGIWKWWLVPFVKTLCNLILNNFVPESSDHPLKSIDMVAGVSS